MYYTVHVATCYHVMMYTVHVPHSESGVVPMSSLSGVGLLGFWESGMGGLIGRRGGK